MEEVSRFILTWSSRFVAIFAFFINPIVITIIVVINEQNTQKRMLEVLSQIPPKDHDPSQDDSTE